MPRRAGYVIAPEHRRGSAAIADALRRNYKNIDTAGVTQDLQTLRDYRDKLSSIVPDAAEKGVMCRDERIEGMRVFQRRTGFAVSRLECLWGLIWIEEHENALTEIARANWTESDGPKQEFIAAFVRRPSSHELGERLREFVVGARSDIEQLRASFDPLNQVIFRLSSRCFTKILFELRRLQILGLCERCGETFFPGHESKRFCSIEFEGKNCAGNARSQKSRNK